MTSSRLNKRVTIQQRTAGKDASGAQVQTWVDVATVWAAVWPMTGRQYIAANAETNTVITKIRIRKRAGIVAAMRVKHGATFYDIEAVLDPDGAWTDLMCKAGASNG